MATHVIVNNTPEEIKIIRFVLLWNAFFDIFLAVEALTL